MLAVVPAWRASALEKRTALQGLAAEQLLRSVLRAEEADHNHTFALHELLRGSCFSELSNDVLSLRVADALAKGELVVARARPFPVPIFETASTTVLEDEMVPLAPVPWPVAPPPVPQPPAEKAVMLDTAAQVIALREAARDGTPLCEECLRQTNEVVFERAPAPRRAPVVARPEIAALPRTTSPDVLAQIRMLKRASQDGVGLCEECLRQTDLPALEEAPVAAVSTKEALDTASQIRVLQEAARVGAPFCEECRRASEARN